MYQKFLFECYDTACRVTSVRGVLVVACDLQLISIF